VPGSMRRMGSCGGGGGCCASAGMAASARAMTQTNATTRNAMTHPRNEVRGSMGNILALHASLRKRAWRWPLGARRKKLREGTRPRSAICYAAGTGCFGSRGVTGVKSCEADKTEACGSGARGFPRPRSPLPRKASCVSPLGCQSLLMPGVCTHCRALPVRTSSP
jgi:hypothetical protein